MSDDRPFVSQEEAAAEFAKLGLRTITARKLRRLATSGKGPPIYREGRTPYYRKGDLLPWAETEGLLPDRRGRSAPLR